VSETLQRISHHNDSVALDNSGKLTFHVSSNGAYVLNISL